MAAMRQTYMYVIMPNMGKPTNKENRKVNSMSEAPGDISFEKRRSSTGDNPCNVKGLLLCCDCLFTIKPHYIHNYLCSLLLYTTLIIPSATKANKTEKNRFAAVSTVHF